MPPARRRRQRAWGMRVQEGVGWRWGRFGRSEGGPGCCPRLQFGRTRTWRRLESPAAAMGVLLAFGMAGWRWRCWFVMDGTGCVYP